MTTRLVTTCILAWAGAAMSGAWDVGSFDNDDATEYLEAPAGSMALAAAEVVAALRGNPSPKLPPEVSEWTRTHKLVVSDKLLRLARTAVVHVRNAESSELAQLWSESDETAGLWHAELDNLLERLV